MSDKIDFQTKAINRDKGGHYIILMGTIHQEDIIFANIYAPNIGAPIYVRKIMEDFKKGTDSNILIVGNFNTPLSIMDTSPKQRVNGDIGASNNTLDQVVLIDMHRMFLPKEAKHTFFFQMYMEYFQR